MAYLILSIMMAAIYLGYSPVPVIVASTAAIVAISYWFSRHPALLRLGASFTGYVLTHVLLSQLDADVLAAVSSLERSVLEFGASDKVMMIVAGLVAVIALGVGSSGLAKKTRSKSF
jgi:hypothetical protein